MADYTLKGNVRYYHAEPQSEDLDPVERELALHRLQDARLAMDPLAYRQLLAQVMYARRSARDRNV